MMRKRSTVWLAGCVVVVSCGSGRSILEAGNPAATSTSTTTTPASVPGTTTPGQTTIATTTTPAVTTTTTPLASLPPCPVDALDDVTTPVELTVWHGLQSEVETTLLALNEQYHAGQPNVRVVLQNQGGYKETIDKYVQSSQDSRPQLVLLPEYMVQRMADSATVIPVDACMEASGYDVDALLPGVLAAFQTGGVQWSMPFNVSNPILYYTRPRLMEAGLNPDESPVSLDELRATSEALVASGAATYGIALDSGVDSGGGWFLEQWLARAGQPYADNGNGRVARATRVLYAEPAGVELLAAAQSLITDGLAVTVGDNPNGQDVLLKLADPAQPAAMGIATSGALGAVINVLDGGLIPGFTSADLGVGPMPGPGDDLFTLVGGASLYIVAGKGDPAAAAAWDYIQFLVEAQTQSTFAAATGYVPVREDALDLDPLKAKYAADPRFQVAYDQLQAVPPDDPNALGPALGPQREVRAVTAGAVAAILNGADVASTLAAAAQQSDALIADYNARN